MGKPIIGILNTWSDLNSCHMHLRLTADAVKRGVFQAGGHPMEIPVMSVGEMLTKPTAMFHRNFLAMETEEMLRANPIDGAVLPGLSLLTNCPLPPIENWKISGVALSLKK